MSNKKEELFFLESVQTNKETIVKLLTIGNLNKPVLLEGNLPVSEDECLVEQDFLKANEIEAKINLTGTLIEKLADYIYETEEHISDEAITNSSAKLFPINTVAIAMGSTKFHEAFFETI